MTISLSNKLEERLISATVHYSIFTWLSPFHWIRLITEDCRELYRTRFVLRNLVGTQLKIRYHRSFLGFFWTLLNPALMLTVQALVFSQLVRTTGSYPYVVYLFAGFVPWKFFMSSIENGSNSLLTAEVLIRKVATPNIIFPVAETIVCLINMAFAMTAMFVILLFVYPHVYPQLVLIIPGTILLSLFTMGLVLISMSLATFFRDFLHLIPIFLQAWYFACPIIYTKDILSPKLQLIINLNPLTHFLSFFQHAILGATYPGDTWPTLANWLISAGWTLGMLMIGYFTYKQLEHDYIFRL